MSRPTHCAGAIRSAESNESSSDQPIGTIDSPTMITTAGRTNAQAVGFSPKTRWANVLGGAVGSALISSVAHGPGTWSSWLAVSTASLSASLGSASP